MGSPETSGALVLLAAHMLPRSSQPQIEFSICECSIIMKLLLIFGNDLVRSSRKEWKFSKIMLLFGLVAFVLINSGFTTEPSSSHAEKVSHLRRAVPFKGSLSVSLEERAAVGSGVASHIGKFEYASVDDPSNFPFLSGTATFTAANRDEIFTTFSGILQDNGNGTLGLTFENTITGGTGRFEGATGSFTSTGTANGATATVNFTGEISY
jgi:hypothetical protein